MRRAALPLACFGIALVLMLAFDGTLTRVLGVAALFAFIVSGVFAIADPAFLDEEPDGS
jgi:hypothetical protein